MIRNDAHIESVTITGIDALGNATLGHAHFKKALFPDSVIVFYEYENRYYYPISLEFRLIDNNLLFLTDELEMRDMEEIKELLASSMLKEEKWTNVFRVAVIRLKEAPRYMQPLHPDFRIPIVDYDYRE